MDRRRAGRARTGRALSRGRHGRALSGAVAAVGRVVVAVLVLVVVSACAGAPAGSGAAVPGPSISASAPPSSHESPSVPLVVMRNRSGATCAVASVTVGGGRAIRVVVDTGAPGLTVPADAVGPDARPTGRHYQGGFVGISFVATLVRAQVSVGGVGGPMVVSTPQPIEVASTPTRLNLCGDAEGNLGIGAGNTDSKPPPMQSPLVQLAPPLSDGFSMSLTGSTGRLTLGKPTTTPRSIALPLPTENGTYPNGHPAYQRDTVLCWTVGTQHGCGPTNIDSGFPFPAIRPDLLPSAGYPTIPSGHTGPALPAGTAVTVTTPNGAVIESFHASPVPTQNQLRLTGLFDRTQANTGIGIFQAATVSDDFTTGQIIITPR